MSDLSNNLFLKTIQNKGDNSLNLVKNLILNNKEIINIPFTITIDNNKITHSPLTYSILKKYSKIAIFLIEKGGDINYKTLPEEDYPIHIACRNGLEEVVEKLLENQKLNINCINKKNETCFNISITSSHTNIYMMLLNYIKKKKESQIDIKKENYIKESVKNMIKNEEKIISNIKKLFEAKKYFKHNSFEILISFVKKMKR
jgi:ankyrin repeat protein